MKIHYAVVGAGWISQVHFMPAVAQTGNSEIAAIVSGNAKNAAKLAAFYGVERIFSYDGYDEMLAGDVVDAVYIALPNAMHADYAIRAAKAGKHVLVEKPLATTVADCEAMIAAAESAEVWLMTAYRLHNDPGTVEALERIRNGAIGAPRIFSSISSFQAAAGNHRLRAENWGGPLQDVGIYCLNAARHVFAAEPIEAIAMSGRGDGDPRFGEVEETVAATLRFPGEGIAQFIASFGAEAADMYRVVGTRGVLTLDPAFRPDIDTALRVEQGDETIFEMGSPSVDHFAGQAAYFSDCILNGVRPEADGSEGLADVAILHAIARAAETGRPQKIHLPARPAHPVPEMVRRIPRSARRLML
jgi:predicted dehydrogenase